MPLLAYALCLIDMELVAWERTCKCEVRLDEDQLRRFRNESFDAIDVLGQRAEIPCQVLAGRKVAVAQQLNRMLTNP